MFDDCTGRFITSVFISRSQRSSFFLYSCVRKSVCVYACVHVCFNCSRERMDLNRAAPFVPATCVCFNLFTDEEYPSDGV